MIEATGLTKRYGDTLAVDDLSFSIRPGHVTGFLGPNGAGKSTTMRLVLGLDRPTSGEVTVDGRPYTAHRDPLRRVGALLDARGVHPARSGCDHLLALARTHGIGRSRVEEVVDLVGLTDVASRPAGRYSLGMGQRLGIAAALLGDPGTILLDEPVNGLDPDGVIWIRGLLRRLADEGRTVLVSSHLMGEMAMVASHLLIIGRGRLLADTTVDEFLRTAAGGRVEVRGPDLGRLHAALTDEATRSPAAHVDPPQPHARGGSSMEVRGLAVEAVGELAARHATVLHELVDHRPTLEHAYLDLTGDEVDYHGHDLTGVPDLETLP